jgi:tetratricopeptide (TPR) repeat protein
MTPQQYERLCELFDQAQARTPDERAALLREVGAGDPSFAAELQAMLADDQRARDEQLLQRPCPVNANAILPPGDWPTVVGAAPPAEASDGLVGRRVGPYLIEQRVGSGGMGSVYRAWREGDYRQRVALKVIRPGLGGGDLLRRFQTERQVLAELAHPHIARLLDGGTTDDGRPYFVMEFIDGEPLDRHCARRQLSTDERLLLLLAVCAAMEYAHARGVLHRDLKPDNVLVTADGTPKVTDFGLAKRLEGAGGGAGATQSGAVLGTPSYMAPEQAAGRRAEVGPATDVYALGAILYELLTGRPPFRAETPLDTLLQVLKAEPLPPSRLHPKLARDLETICLKCLQKDPVRRYPGVAALADDLRRFRDGQPIRARPVPAWERAYRWARRRPAQAALGFAVGLAVLGGAGTALFYGLYRDQQATARLRQVERGQHVNDLWVRGLRFEADEQLGAAKESFDGALAEIAAVPGAVPDDLRRQIEERRDLVRRRIQERSDRQQALERCARFRAHRDEVLSHAANVRAQDADANAARIRHEAPAALAALGLAVGERPGAVSDGLSPYQAHLGSPERFRQLAAECFEVLFLWAEAEAALPPDLPAAEHEARSRQALRLLDAAAALGPAYQLPVPRALHLRRASHLARLGDEAGARAARELAAAQEPRTALDHYLAALDAYRGGEFARAAAASKEVLRLEPEHPWALWLQALCHFKGRHYAEAKGELLGCLSRRPDFFWARLLLGAAEGQLGQFDDARLDFARALERADDPLTRWAVLASRGAMWVRCRRWDEAVADLRQAIQERPDAPEAYVALALAYQGRRLCAVSTASLAGPYVALALACPGGQPADEAVTALDQALDRRLTDPRLYRTRAELRLARGEAAAARRDFERAIALAPEGGAAEALASDYVQLAHLQHQAGEHPAALASCDAALRVRPDYPPAHRQRAETLLAQGNHAAAGQALDRYLENGPSGPDVYLARGLIHLQRRAYAEAAEAFTQSLLLRPDVRALSYRGWAHLRLGAPRLALDDFQAALRREPTHPDALCGRGYVRVSLGDVSAGVADAEAALRHGPRKAPLLYSVACLYARAAGELAAQSRGQPDLRLLDHCRRQAVALLRATLRDVPEERRKAFWRDNVQREHELAPFLSARELLDLSREYGR